MKRFSEQLHKKSLTVKLRAAEKRDLRERVVSYMEYHPLPAEMKRTKVIKEPKLLTEEYKSVAIPFKMIAGWAAGIAAIVIIAVPFVAERSVPGDGLYAVKRFNEDVRGTLSFNTIQKVEWETELLNRRIAEARLLASEGKLTDAVEEEVAQAVRNHSANAQKNIEVLRSEDEDEATLASFALETTLAVQSAALNDEQETVVSESGEEASSATMPSALAAAVEDSLVQTNATNEASTIPAFGKLMAKIEMNTTRVYELRNSLQTNMSAEQSADISRRIEDIERSIAEAIEMRSDSDNNDSEVRKILIDSLQRTQKLIVFMTDIDVSQSIDIEKIVPVVLTQEEKANILSEYETEIEEKVALIEVALPTIDSAGLVEKSQLVLSEIEEIMSDANVTTDFASERTRLFTALELVRDIFILVELEEPAEPEVLETPGVSSTSSEEVASSTEPLAEGETEEVTASTENTTDISTGQVDTEWET